MLLRVVRRLSALWLVALAATWLPSAALLPASLVSAAPPSTALLRTAPANILPSPVPVTPAADTTPPQPVLSVALNFADDTVPVGDTTTISVTVTNRGLIPAAAVHVTLPVPDGIVVVAGDDVQPGQSLLTWDIRPLDAQAQAVRRLTVRATGALKGSSALFQAQAQAPDAVNSATDTGGFMVLPRGLGAARAVFTPGVGASLTSKDGRVSLRVPPGLFRRTLTLQHRSLLDARDALLQQKRPIPPRSVGAHRAFPPFVLDATDSLNADIHLFDAPLTLTVSYTPDELQALGIREADLQLYWFNETSLTWEAVATAVDVVAHTATAQLNHFTTLTLSDGSSPSAAYLPALQNWQVSSFTGAATYSYPIALPSGPGGLTPKLGLSYNSAASDGSGGTRPKWQAGWVGKGWDVDGLGYVATNENTGSSGHTWDSYSMVFAGQSLDLVKGKRVDSQVNATAYTDYALDHWNWHAADDSFTRVTAIPAPDGSGAYAWRAWTKDGTRYEFDQALRWGENAGNTYWTYKWLLSKVVDTHGNAIAFTYAVDSIANVQTIHPTII